MRLQVFLSNSGVASRRSAAAFIRAGRVYVNEKKILSPAFRVSAERDRVFFDNRRITPLKKSYIMLNKPGGVTTTKKDPFAANTVMDLLPRSFHHLNPLGRLDRDTTGLLLLTNDGELINRFTHPSFNVEKVYAVKLDRRLSRKDKLVLEKGICLNGRCTAPCRITLREKNRLEITLHEGRKRQIKRMFKKLGYRVMGLKRLRQGHLDIGALPEGGWRFLTKKEIDDAIGQYIG